MTLQFGRLVSLLAVSMFFDCSVASACNPGDVQCEGGYRYVCECWSDGGGCRYAPSGTCDQQARQTPGAASFSVNLWMASFALPANLVCRGRQVASAREECSGEIRFRWPSR